MSICETRVPGTTMSYPCVLDESHVRSGPPDDPEPHMAEEVDRSKRAHEAWRAREIHREQAAAHQPVQVPAQREETSLESIMAADARAAAEYQVAQEEPEHNVLADGCMMRPFDSAPPREGERCEICTPRPQVLAENDNLLRQGLMHNIYDPECAKTDSSVLHLGQEYCYLCRGMAEPQPSTEHVPEEDLVHLDADYDPAENLIPTKQRPGDQVLPSAAVGQSVQDHIIAREQADPTHGSPAIIEAMEESKRVGVERYGDTLRTLNGRSTIRDAMDEARDLFVYLSSMVAVSEASKTDLVAAVARALDDLQRTADPASLTTEHVAEVAVDRILDWVLMQRLGPDGDLVS